LVIEVEFNGNPSALSTTKADWWVFYDGEGLIWTTPEDIRQLIRVKDMAAVEFIGKGDNVKKRAYLVKRDDIKSIAIKCMGV